MSGINKIDRTFNNELDMEDIKLKKVEMILIIKQIYLLISKIKFELNNTEEIIVMDKEIILEIDNNIISKFISIKNYLINFYELICNYNKKIYKDNTFFEKFIVVFDDITEYIYHEIQINLYNYKNEKEIYYNYRLIEIYNVLNNIDNDIKEYENKLDKIKSINFLNKDFMQDIFRNKNMKCMLANYNFNNYNFNNCEKGCEKCWIRYVMAFVLKYNYFHHYSFHENDNLYYIDLSNIREHRLFNRKVIVEFLNNKYTFDINSLTRIRCLIDLISKKIGYPNTNILLYLCSNKQLIYHFGETHDDTLVIYYSPSSNYEEYYYVEINNNNI